MKKPPVLRQDIYDLYWYFASERQAAFERRYQGQPAPWTKDPILQQYKFCNVFRAADRVSQYMIRTVIYHDEPRQPADSLFQIVAFRTFSRQETWESVRRFLGRYPIIADLKNNNFLNALEFAKHENGGLYTGAFILCATNAYHQPSKHRNHVELFRHMFVTDNLADALLHASSLEHVFKLLHAYPLMGDFMSYQTAIDLNYSDLINFDENDFTKPGPGAMRGLRKVFADFGDYTPAQLILQMVERQHDEFKRLNLPFHGLFGRDLHAIDCQGLFCEVDKYCRVAQPQLKSARKSIKAAFKPQVTTPSLFFPPKWQINQNSLAISQNRLQ